MEQTHTEHLDEVYPEAEFQRDLMHCDVVSGYQRELEQKLGHPVDYSDAEFVAYSWFGITDTTVQGYRAGKEARIEKVRQKYAAGSAKS
jgi:hypothetical protein